MRKFTKMVVALLACFAGVTFAHADEEIALTADMFYNWDGYGADAVSTSAATVDFNIGNDATINAGGMVCGTSSVNYLIYADLTGSSKLLINGDAGLQLRVLMNRQESNSGPLVEKNVTIDSEGNAEVDLTDQEYVHINAIKLGWGSAAGKVASIKMVKPSDPLALPKEALKNALNAAKLQNAFAKTEKSWAALTEAVAAGEAALAAEDATAESLGAATTAVNEAVNGLQLKVGYTNLTAEMFLKYASVTEPGEGEKAYPSYQLFTASDLPYGDGNVGELNWADLTAYKNLVVTTAGETKPRFCLNRLEAGGQQAETMEDSKMLDINPNNAFTWSTEKYLTAENGVYNLDLTKIVADYTFARLHCIKKQGWGAGVFVTGMYLYRDMSYAIVGDMTGGWEADVEMTATDEEGIYTLTVEGFEAEAKTYEYKLRANKAWGIYELPAEGNQNWVFGTDDYPAGKYDLTFTADVLNHTLTLEVVKAKEPFVFPEGAVVYDFEAAAEAGENPANKNGSAAAGQAFYGWEKADKTDSKRQDYKGYEWAEGSVLPEVCHVWRRSDRINGNIVEGGLNCPNDREFAVDGLEPGCKVIVVYDATNAAEGSKELVWAIGDGSSDETLEGPRATATIGGVEAVTGETTIASGAEIVVNSITSAENGTGYIVFQVKKGMVINQIAVVPAPVVEKSPYYLVGNMTDWAPKAEYQLVKNEEAEGEEYMITVDLTTTSQFKIAKSEDGTTIADEDWYPTGMGNNYGENGEITEDGSYTVYFRPNADGGSDWFNSVIYVTKNTTTAISFMTVDTRNAVVYNMNGQRVMNAQKGLFIVNGKKVMVK